MSINATSTAYQAAATAIRRPPPQGDWGGSWGSPSVGSSGSAGSPATAQASGSTDAFQKLATDLQAALVSLQGGTSTTAATSGASGSSTDALSTLQQDLQSLSDQMQAGPGASQGTGGTKGTGHAHHHHHAPPSSPDTTDAASANTTGASTAAGTGQSQGKTLLADLLQAFQAYGSAGKASSPTTSSGLALAA